MDEKVTKAAEDSSAAPGRSPDDLALDMMKFIAVTTGYGRTAGSSGAGFSSVPGSRGPEEYATALIDLFHRCRKAIRE